MPTRQISYVPPDDQTQKYEVEDACGFTEFDITEYAQAFRLSDVIGDGKITADELPLILKRLGEFPSEDALEKIVNAADPEGQGVYSFQDFLKIMCNFDRHIVTEQELLEAFELFDQDNSGTIEAGEIKHVLGTLGDKMTEDEAEHMVALADKDGDGSIGYEEFVKTILGERA